MAAPAKFLFDLDFAAPERSREKTMTPADVAVMVANAESRAYRAGYDAAQQEAKVQSDRRNALALEQIGVSIASIARGIQSAEQRIETESVDVAIAIARKLCGELLATEPLAEIMTLIRDCFKNLVATPHIVIRINDELFAEANERIERLAQQNGFQGKLVILAEPDIASGDCRIEWADGGVCLERSATEAKINELVGRYMSARQHSSLPRL